MKTVIIAALLILVAAPALAIDYLPKGKPAPYDSFIFTLGQTGKLLAELEQCRELGTPSRNLIVSQGKLLNQQREALRLCEKSMALERSNAASIEEACKSEIVSIKARRGFWDKAKGAGIGILLGIVVGLLL